MRLEVVPMIEYKDQVARYLAFIETSWKLATNQVEAAEARLTDTQDFILMGSGDSHFAAIGVASFLEKLTGAKVLCMRSMDAARYHLPDLPSGHSQALVMGFSV